MRVGQLWVRAWWRGSTGRRRFMSPACWTGMARWPAGSVSPMTARRSGPWPGGCAPRAWPGVAIERGDGPVVEELLSAGLAVFVVPSRQIKGLRTRYGPAGNKDDRFDAYVLADTLRTDGHRWKPLRPDTGPTRALRALCRSR